MDDFKTLRGNFNVLNRTKNPRGAANLQEKERANAGFLSSSRRC